MNVGYDGYNAKDVAEILKVDYSTVVLWLNNKYMRYQDVSEPGSTRPRYLITDDEVNRVKQLRAKYGRNWVMYNTITPAKKEEAKIAAKPVANVKAEDEEKKLTGKNQLIMKIEKVKELKDELENLDARRNQVLAEIELLKNEIIDAI